MHLASHGRRSGMLLNALQHAGESPPLRVIGTQSQQCRGVDARPGGPPPPGQAGPGPGVAADSRVALADPRAGAAWGARALHGGGGELGAVGGGAWTWLQPSPPPHLHLCPSAAAAAGDPGAPGVRGAIRAREGPGVEDAARDPGALPRGAGPVAAGHQVEQARGRGPGGRQGQGRGRGQSLEPDRSLRPLP